MRTCTTNARSSNPDHGASHHGGGSFLFAGDARPSLPRLRVIEFCGLPGAGKTTAMDRLAAHMAADHRVVYSRRDLDRLFPRLKGGRKLRSIVLAGPAGWAVAGRAFALTPPRFSLTYRMRRALQVPRFFIPLQHVANASPGATIILDDWMVNVFAGTVLAGSLRHSEAFSMVKYFNIQFDTCYVFLDVEPNTAVERLRRRAHERRSGRLGVEATIFDSMDIGEIAKLTHAKIHILKTMKAAMVDNMMDVYSINAEGSGDDIYRSLCSAVRHRTNNPSRDHALQNTTGANQSQRIRDRTRWF